MRLRQAVLVTTLVAGWAVPGAAQDPNPEPKSERRVRVWTMPHIRRHMSDLYRFRMDPERTRIVERALERSGRVRIQALNRLREREFSMRDRVSERLNSSLRRSLQTRERAIERVRERMEKLRDLHRFTIRRRSRTI